MLLCWFFFEHCNSFSFIFKLFTFLTWKIGTRSSRTYHSYPAKPQTERKHRPQLLVQKCLAAPALYSHPQTGWKGRFLCLLRLHGLQVYTGEKGLKYRGVMRKICQFWDTRKDSWITYLTGSCRCTGASSEDWVKQVARDMEKDILNLEEPGERYVRPEPQVRFPSQNPRQILYCGGPFLTVRTWGNIGVSYQLIWKHLTWIEFGLNILGGRAEAAIGRQNMTPSNRMIYAEETKSLWQTKWCHAPIIYFNQTIFYLPNWRFTQNHKSTIECKIKMQQWHGKHTHRETEQAF